MLTLLNLAEPFVSAAAQLRAGLHAKTPAEPENSDGGADLLINRVMFVGHIRSLHGGVGFRPSLLPGWKQRHPLLKAEVSAMGNQPVLYVIACGGRPAGRLGPFVKAAIADDWRVAVITTPDGAKFTDSPRLHEMTGFPVRHTYKQPDEPDVLPMPDVIAVVPATFNTINKWAQGISDTLALGLLNEAIGLRTPVIAAPWPNVALARHPAFNENVTRLREWGVKILMDRDRLPDPQSGEPGAATFPWHDLTTELRLLKAGLTLQE